MNQTYQFAQINGTKIHYELRGEGTAVTFIHAGINNLHMWDDQMEAFTAVHQTLRYDFRGWGATPSPVGQFQDHDDLYHLLRHLGIKRTIIVGCSDGGKIGINFTLAHPEMVIALVLVGPGLDGYTWTAEGFAEKEELMSVAYKAEDMDKAAEMQTQIWVDGLDRPSEQVNGDVRQRAYEMILHTLKLGDGAGERLEMEPPAIERLAEIQVPVRILVGEYDMPDIHAICELLEEKLPHTKERTIIRNSAHLPNMERPSIFNKIILGFLEKLAWQATIYAILSPEKEEAAVWLQENDNGYTLPNITRVGRLDELSKASVQRRLQDKFGNIQLLYTVHFQEDKETKKAKAVFVLDNMGAKVENGRWVDRQTLPKIALTHPAHKRLIETRLLELESGNVPVLRPSWAKRGWYAQAQHWIQTTLTQQGHTLTAPLKIVKNWSLSYVMRIKTNNGDFYFKAVANLPLFVNEAVMTSKLAELFPQNILTPTAIDAQRDWMLLPALPQILGWGAPIEQRKEFLRQFAQLQKTAVAHIDALIEAGCFNHRLTWIQTQIKPLIHAKICQETLNEEEVTKLINLIPHLHMACTQLANTPIPQTIVHGDLHGGNVGIQNGQYIFFDWTDPCITHPFFDMLDIFYEQDTVVQIELRDAYLAEWAAFAPMPQLLNIWTLAEVGAAIHHAISFWQILIHIEPHARADLSHMLPIWLRKILMLGKQLEEGYGC